jgi:D-alanyl-D-alanine carboxypeptidase
VDQFGDRIKNVTIRELLSMRSSIPDYGELDYQLKHPKDDIGPARTAQMFGSMIAGQPLGTCSVYSSMGYVLLGLVLIGQNETTWDEYDQNVWRELLPDIKFATRGTCSQYVDFREAQCADCKDVNVMDMSCTNGFGCGNLVSTPQEVARFVWQLFEGKLLRPSTVQEMLHFTRFGTPGKSGRSHTDFCNDASNTPGIAYGLGVEKSAGGGGIPLPGHGGDTYGFFSISAYDRNKRAVYVAGHASDRQGPYDIWFDLHNHDLLQDHVVV